jgi:hypothetical protein
MALFTRDGPEKERPTTVLSCAPELLLSGSKAFTEGLRCVPAEIDFAEARADGVHYNSCARQGGQCCEVPDRQDFEELG